MNEILKQVRKQIEEISEGLYYCTPSPSGLPYLDIYGNGKAGRKWVCRVELLEETNKYQITPHSSNRPSEKVGKDILLMEMLKELISDG